MRLAVTVKMLLENSDIHSADFQPRAFDFFSRGKRISTIGLMSTTTFLDCYTIEGTVDGDVFLQICAVVSASTPDAIQWYKPK